MSFRRIGMSEARRLLPQLAEAIAREGGRVDVTRRGHAAISIVRTGDLDARRSASRGSHPEAFRVELVEPQQDLVEMIRALRSRIGRARKPQPAAKRTKR